MRLFSYHIFMFPFKWETTGKKHLLFSEKTSLKDFKLSIHSPWEHIATPKTDLYKRELYNEKNFFYPFTHQVLYDESPHDNIINHYERKEPYDVEVNYKIHVVAQKEDNYTLKVRSIGLNLYSTGVGTLLFYLENDSYPDIEDVLRINQFGRRIYPPYIDVEKGISGTKNQELADYIAIEGLNGNPLHYYEDFSGYHPGMLWKPARFIDHLLKDFSRDITPNPVIDDRMFVMCWLGDNEISQKIKGNYDAFKNSDDWYRFLFVDGDWATCQNQEMKKKLIQKHTYERWQKEGSLYGITRYSTVLISENSDFAISVLLRIFRTIYARMTEVSLTQRASILKFSEQVTTISKLEYKDNNNLVRSIGDLYRQYIRFINKVYFREVTAQEQGIEIYDMLQNAMKIRNHVEELDGEIEELHSYVNILEDKERNSNIELLTIISSVIIIPTLIVAFADMHEKAFWLPLIFVPIATLTVFSIKNKRPENQKLRLIYAVFIVVFLLLFILTLIH